MILLYRGKMESDHERFSSQHTIRLSKYRKFQKGQSFSLE